ncbi:WG repeat-containing protein [Psychrobacter urativorans]|uniref:WG repeat-containing protein n=1 Tax=Psychrobacter urativorans TaxID=45610 RepID=UPI003BB71A67
MDMLIKKLIDSFYANVLPISVFCLTVVASVLITTSAQATINCAGYLPNSYFERIDDNNKFAGKLIESADSGQQLEDLNGKVLLDNLTDAYILMNKYLLASKDTVSGKKYGVVTATGEVIVPFAYDDIVTEPDIYTSFIVSIDMPNGLIKQGIVDREGYWIYPAVNNEPQQRRIDNGYGNYRYAQPTQQLIKAVDVPLNLTAAAISHAHYDSDNDRDYFLIKSLVGAGKSAQVGLLNDQSNWVIAQQYDELQPLNACTGQPLYLQAISTKAFTSKMERQTALLDQNASVIIPFAANQNIEVFNSRDSSTLFLRSDLIEGSTATGMTEDIKNNIVSAQIIDAKGKVILLSESAIVKLLYHQLYAYKQDGKFGLIDDRANMVLAPQFDSYRDEGNKVWVEKQGKMFDLATLIELD